MPSVQNNTHKKFNLHYILLIFIAVSAGFLGGWIAQRSGGIDGTTGAGQARQQIISETAVISDIAKSVGPSVVSVNVTSQTATTDFFGYSRNIEQVSAGTGVIISADGLVVTNRHVIPQGVTSVSVTLSDGTELTDVEVIGRTSASDPLDVAFLRIKDKKGKELKAATLGDSGRVEVGDKVVAIGNALGQFQNTVTSGIISGYGRNLSASDGSSVETLQNLFQTDTAINEGNSGGPLVNISGEVIALNTAVAGGTAENIGFAIPINDISGLIKSVREKGKLLRPYLGVHYVTLNDDFAYKFNLSVKRGAYLAPRASGSPILENSPASKAGLKEKDIITKVNDQSVDEKNSLSSLLSKFTVDEEVTLSVIRDGNEIQVKIRLEAAPTG